VTVPHHLRGYGLIELALDRCAERLAGAEIPSGRLERAHRAASREQTVAYLRHLTFPATRYALFAVNDRWTAIVNNARDGSDLHDEQRGVSLATRARTCRVVDQSGGTTRVRGYKVRTGYPGRIFVLAGRDGEPLRQVHCVLDGDRWDFSVHGTPLAAEAAFDYDARRKRDRFTSDNLRALLASLGVVPAVPEAFDAADRVALLAARRPNQEVALAIEAAACTPEQADDPGYGYFQRGLDWVGHVETHAVSIVWDMARAVLLNPDLEADARPYLDAARRQLGATDFERTWREAAEHLERSGG
jgi:hypothetical protein